MFAPSPSKEDGWYVIPGNLQDGRRVDLMPITRDDYGMHRVSNEKPQDVPASYKNEHWRKLRRRAPGRASGETVMLLQLACVLVVAILFFGDPRVRSTYDVFGLALLAASIVELFGLGGPGRKPVD
jgi:hypothetical protein